MHGRFLHPHTTNEPSGMTVIAAFAIFAIIAAIAFGAFLVLDFYQKQPVTNTNISVTTGSIADQLAAQSHLKQFRNTTEVALFLESATLESQNISLGRDLAVSTFEAPVFGLAETQSSTDAFGTGETKDYSPTNVQVEGVDEGDVVKTDGDFVYSISSTDVVIVDATNTETPQIISRISFDSEPSGLYINGNTLAVYGTFYSSYRPRVELEDTMLKESSVAPSISSDFTYVNVYDISDTTKPEELRTLKFEGQYIASRMIEDVVYVVTSQYAYSVIPEYPIPLVIDNGETLPLSGTRCNCPDMYYIDTPYESYVFTSVNAISLSDSNAELGQELFLLESTEQVYVSESNMYIAYTKYLNEYALYIDAQKKTLLPLLNAADQNKITDIENAPEHVLSKNEKDQKIIVLLEQFISKQTQTEQSRLSELTEKTLEQDYADIASELEKTVIHRIGLDGLSIKLEASGEVIGHVLNQFSMDERGGNLRIATTRNRQWSRYDVFDRDSYNNVYVLNSSLKIVGKVEDLANGEQIYAARFIGDRAYIVTFRQIDPLFVIDLSSPQKPAVLGELKVPGFSSYLHPYNDTALIGIGKEADTDGRVTGLKLSLYDVSDVDNLQEIDTYVFDGAWNDSLVLSDHKAFLFSGSKNLLVIPITLYDYENDNVFRTVQTNGAAVFTITGTGFEYRDRIDHSDGTASDNETRTYGWYDYYDTAVKRSFYIENTLFTLSTKYLKGHTLDTLVPESSLVLVSS